MRYLLEKAGNLPLPKLWVGDLPYALSQEHRWTVIKIKHTHLKPGDLIFTCRAKRISHIAIALTTHQIFHCVLRRGAVIDSAKEFLKKYPRPYHTPAELIAMRDVRSYRLESNTKKYRVEGHAGSKNQLDRDKVRRWQ